LAKSALDAELHAFVRQRWGESGIAVTELGVEEVILPGEIRELVNKVVEKWWRCRRRRRRARSSTPKDSPLLLRLKELESLERLVEKVGRIDLRAGEGQGLDALLSVLVRLKAPESASEVDCRRKAASTNAAAFAWWTATHRRRCEFHSTFC